ncbi:MAG: helix-turn-helix domain-containing protein [Saprospiraceae bacterium]|jgi:transcriptional regulator with XRE-family HTH domain|nr:helix-turn-helix domain-containing protein [Saprospiraceae bacterium]MDP5048594.1 helix-turn-helix domain-containing protein [Saprospiraceae bacterium]
MQYGLNKKPADWMLEMAKRHKMLRTQAGFTQSELARRSGVSLGSLKRFETSGQISIQSLFLLIDVLGRLEDFDTILKPIENMKEIERLFSDKKSRI